MSLSGKAAGRAARRLLPALAAWFVALPAQNLPPAAVHVAKAGAHLGSAPDRAVRELMDPHSGERWRLLPNPNDPSGPGQWIRSGEVSRSATGHKEIAKEMVIHRGDRVVVEEHSEAVQAWLEATALEPAAAGSRFSVRLKIGGRVVRAAAIAAGRAEIER